MRYMTISNTPSNSFSLEDAIADAAAIGAQEGETYNMKHELMIRLASHAASGAVSVDAKSTDVARFAEAYFKGKQSGTYAAAKSEFNEGTFKKTVSQFRAVALCGAHPSGAGVETLETAVSIAASLRGREPTFKKSFFQSLVDVAVVQKKSEHPLTPEQIADAINPQKEDKPFSLAERIEALTKTLSNLIEGTTDADGNQLKPPAASICPVASQRLEATLAAGLLALEAANKAEGRTAAP